MKNQVSTGLTMGYTATAKVSSGDPVLVGAVLGVAIADIAADETGDLSIEGVYSLPKVADTAITQGEQLYWDATNSVVTSVSTDNTACGKAFAAADAEDDTVDIKINV